MDGIVWRTLFWIYSYNHYQLIQ
uniref:Uncharacterized protein n=1 Tax=Anguilla anguilla TaxID=7936 RepID=A0A0E9UKE2_ANGAN